MARTVRYAVVGLGHIAQVAVLPAFKHASKNSELTAFVSDTPKKLEKLADEYGAGFLYGYERYDECLRSGEIDAVYIALPNHLHREYTVRAAKAGIHVLCEKPMAVTARSRCVFPASVSRASSVVSVPPTPTHSRLRERKVICGSTPPTPTPRR